MTDSMFDEFQHEPRQPLLDRWFAPDVSSGDSWLRARWLFLRALGAVFFSAFYSLWFQILGLVGSRGILPAQQYLPEAKAAIGAKAYWYIPSLVWLHPSDGFLRGIVVAGLIASVALILNLWPRVSIAVAGICFLSFIGVAQEFSAYQSDGMLLEAAFLSLFFAPRGVRPGLAASQPPSRASLFLLQWEWFRIYFESGVVKILSGEEQWRNLTAMDKYYENGPLPTWLGWYTQQFPHAFHAASTAATLVIELLVVWLLFLPKRSRIVAFFLTAPLQIGIILTANYAFLNYLVLALGFLLLDDRFFTALGFRSITIDPSPRKPSRIAAIVLPAHLLTTSAMFLFPYFPTAVLLGPSRIANSFGLFAVMTRGRYEIEFQGSKDGTTWVAYPFRYKPQDPKKAPGIFAPYQPRFDWNLWFASFGSIDENRWILNVQERLLENSPQTLQLFAGNPFLKQPPKMVRAVLWQYWFTTKAERAATGAWWRRELRGEYSPPLTRP
jgi:phage terminase large subunit-like protein